ncbi:MAG TPA: hypothetical protein VKV04_09060 [Verrucomicrobiae bacterium]|nr:hypothetical protein [Verrucomicrobiae bacterium]
MATSDDKKRALPKPLICVAIAIVVVITLTLLYRLCVPQTGSAPADPAYVEKLKSAKHFQSTFPAQKQTIDLAKRSNLRNAALNAIGIEPREVRGLATGDPLSVFAMLSHLGGFGEIIWVDQWTNFVVKLPPTSIPGQVVVPRRDAVRGALDAIEASGGCLVKAGPNRYLVAKVSDREKYEAAIRALDWLGKGRPPWDVENQTNKPNAATNRNLPVSPQTIQAPASAAAGR